MLGREFIYCNKKKSVISCSIESCFKMICGTIKSVVSYKYFTINDFRKALDLIEKEIKENEK